MDKDIEKELVQEVRGRLVLKYRWSFGKALSRFFEETKLNKKLYGLRCKKCMSVLVPPTAVCGRCYEETGDDWVELSNQGILETWTTVYLPFPGQPTEPPYTYGLIKLDGADTIITHLISEIDPKEIKPEMRVVAVWADNRVGDLFDIKYFKPIL